MSASHLNPEKPACSESMVDARAFPLLKFTITAATELLT
jgi:hypothetical protein